MTLQNPAALWILAVLPLFLFVLGFRGWIAKRELGHMFQLDLRCLRRRQAEKYALAGTLMALLVSALALPSVVVSSTATAQKAGEIALLVDVSASMAARKDPGSPSRLERVKPMLYEIIDRMEASGKVRISLHGFTNIARSHVPFVAIDDYLYLRESIRRVLNIYSTPGEGSSLGRPILDVADKYSSDEKVKLIVLFSDGEPFIGITRGMQDAERGRIEEAIKKASEAGIKVITVGVGEPEGAKIPQYDAYGAFTGEYASLRGVDFVSYLEEQGLKELASRTGGKYFTENDSHELISYIEDSLAVATVEGVSEQVTEYRSVAHWFVLAALPAWAFLARRHILS